jgi:hypothetical protein
MASMLQRNDFSTSSPGRSTVEGMSAPPQQTVTVTWNSIEAGEPLAPGAYLITRPGQSGWPEVQIAGYTKGTWSIGGDDKGEPINGPADKFNIVAWAEIPRGFRT